MFDANRAYILLEYCDIIKYMPKKIVTPAIRKIVFGEKRRTPHLGVRPLSELLKKKYSIILSKSAINKILVSSGLKEKKGRKNSLLIYKGKSLIHCGLFLLRCLDYQVGIFDYLSLELKSYFPKISEDLLKRLIILASFSALLNEDPKKSIKREGFLRLAGLEHFPARKMNYFKDQLSQYKPKVDLKLLKDTLISISTIKFFFNNGHCSYFDAKMSTLWGGLCRMKQFFLPLRAAVRLIEKMIEDKTIIIGYTKSFGYLSPLTFDFLKAMDKGIKKVEFLDERGKVVKELKVSLPKVSFFIGYYPEILNKGVTSMGTPKGIASLRFKRFKSFFWEGIGEFLCRSSLTRFSQPERKQELMLNNVLIKQGASSLPGWGLLTGSISSKKVRVAFFLKKYLYLWPDAEKSFIDDMRVIEKSIFSPSKNIPKGMASPRGYLAKMLPKSLVFEDPLDFVRVGQILSVIFKEMIWGWEPKNREGDFSIGKDYLRISLKKVPREVKKRFNNGHFYLDGRIAFIQ